MARALRIEYPGAIYHVMSRGDHREPIFSDETDRQRFIETLGEACAKTDWQVHAFCLMGNHFHLVVETPGGNLVAGMRWFLSTYTSRFNRRHKLFGHLFSGRYKSLIVDGESPGYLPTVCDYVHLNPARARLLRPRQPLSDYPWSSWPSYLRAPSHRPPWLRVDRLLGGHAIAKDTVTGRRHLEQHLEERRDREEGDDFKAIRRGWCLGDEIFRRDLLAQAHGRAGENHPAEIRRQTAEAKARRVLGEELDKLGWTEADLVRQAKGDVRKVHIARRLRSETAVTLKWIAQNLHMGVWTYVSNQLQNSNLTRATQKKLRLYQ